MCNVDTVNQEIRKALQLREKYIGVKVAEYLRGIRIYKKKKDENEILLKGLDITKLEMVKGIIKVPGLDTSIIPTLDEFYEDMDSLYKIRTCGTVASFCFHRLKMLDIKFELYCMIYGEEENKEATSVPHRDFYNVRKVDTHVHHSAAMNAKHLLTFIKQKLKNSPDTVCTSEGKTLGQVFAELGFTSYDLSLDKLNVLADNSLFQRFDRFNEKYSPLGQSTLRSIFLKTDNFMQGQYLAEMTHELLDHLEEHKYHLTEWRLSIHGRHNQEFLRLAKWVLNNDLVHSKNSWMIQIPRLYTVYKAAGEIETFGELLSNIFLPLFEATLYPEKHPEVAQFMELFSGFDTVDDESKGPLTNSRYTSSRQYTPDAWTMLDNPSYKYYSYYMYANIRILNLLRACRGLRPYDFRPHCGEAGELHHLDTGFLLAANISHGINLRKCPCLQYLFYLAQIGLAVAPCSNNQLFLSYEQNPFPKFFKRGMNVSLSSDDPLIFHQTREPLLEEYSIAKQIWRLTSVDMCEIAKSSVLMSGFSDQVKLSWVKSLDRWKNCIKSTNVPNLRNGFRARTFKEEWSILQGGSALQFDSLIKFLNTQCVRSPSMQRFSIPHLAPEELKLDELWLQSPNSRKEQHEMAANFESNKFATSTVSNEAREFLKDVSEQKENLDTETALHSASSSKSLSIASTSRGLPKAFLPKWKSQVKRKYGSSSRRQMYDYTHVTKEFLLGSIVGAMIFFFASLLMRTQ